jgi:hypothetical protein
MNTITCRSRTTRQICNNIACLATAGARDIDEVDVCDVDLAGILCASSLVDVKVALVQYDRAVSFLNVNVFIGDVVDVSVSDVRACPCFETRAVLAVEECYLLDPCVGNVVLDASVLANRVHGDAVSGVAPQVLDVNVGGVEFGRETVVSYVDASIGDGEAIDIERVEAVSVLW